jgi:hypothetical protein
MACLGSVKLNYPLPTIIKRWMRSIMTLKYDLTLGPRLLGQKTSFLDYQVSMCLRHLPRWRFPKLTFSLRPRFYQI